LIILLIFSISPLHTQGQGTSDPFNGYVIWEDRVYPSEAVSYEEMTKKQMDLYAEQGFPTRVDVYHTTDFTYYWVMQVENYAGIDTLYMEFNKINRNVPAEVKDLREGFAGTYESTLTWTCYFDRSLSYRPGNQPVPADENRFMYLGFCYPIQGRMEEVREAMKGFVSLAANKNASLGWDTFIGDMGVEAPMLFWVSFAQNPTEYFTRNSADFDLMGTGADMLWDKMTSQMRKYEERSGWYRRDLSYVPSP
jgi:hypothetical protein